MDFDAKQHFESAIKFGLQEQYDQALIELKRSVDLHFDSDNVIVSLGVAYTKRGLGNNALECYEKVLERNPHHAEAHYFRGNILFIRKLIPQSIQAYSEAIKLDPELINAHEKPIPQNRLTDYNSTPSELVWLREPAMKIIECNHILEKDSGDTEAYMMRAASYAKLQNFQRAADDYTSVLHLVPNDAQVLGYRGLVLSLLGKDQEALQDYERAIGLEPNHVEAYFNRGSLFIKLERYKEAVDNFTVVVNSVPGDFQGYFGRGKAYFGAKNFEGAIEDFKKVLELMPAMEEAYLWLGDSYERGGLPMKAIPPYLNILHVSDNPQLKKLAEERLRMKGLKL